MSPPRPAPPARPPTWPLWQRILREAGATAAETLQQSVRPVFFFTHRLRRRGLRKTALEARLILGQKLYDEHAGDPSLRARIQALGEQILAGTKKSQRRLTSDRHELLLKLGDPFLVQGAEPPAAVDACHRARAACSELENFQERTKAVRPFPTSKTGWRRAGVGFGVVAAGIACAIFILLSQPAARPLADESPRPEMSTQQIYAASAKSVGLIRSDKGSGTGFLVRPTMMLTNAHVIDMVLIKDLKVYFPSAGETGKNPLSAKLLYLDSRRDIAILEIQSTLEPLELAARYDFKAGQSITVIGNPGVDKLTLENAVNQGVISTRTKVKDKDFYQLGISVNPGNSGGPVFDSTGQVIGVVTLKAQEQEGIAFCIPVQDVRKALAAVANLSPEKRAEAEGRHTMLVIFQRLTLAGQIYGQGLSMYTRSWLQAQQRGVPPAVVLEAAKKSFAERYKDADHKILDDVRDAVEGVGSDPNLPAAARQQMIELWTTYKEMKDYVDNPRGTYNSFAQKANELADKYKRLVEALRLTLGLETRE
jgi:S1-C subfamily serine protease